MAACQRRGVGFRVEPEKLMDLNGRVAVKELDQEENGIVVAERIRHDQHAAVFAHGRAELAK